jgi:5-methylcytosine-specific restriction endonuclease McrA
MGLIIKQCSRCKRILSVKNFYHDCHSSDGYKGQCKDCKRTWQQSENGKRSIKKYCDKNRQRLNKYLKEYAQTINGIYHYLLHSAKRRKINFKIKFNDFVKWYNSQSRICIYCKRKESEALKYGKKKYYKLTIDRKNNDKGYTLNNIVLACYKCNTVKGSDLSFQEMLIIGEVLHKIYNKNDQ